jgi:general secretion pathway protein F
MAEFAYKAYDDAGALVEGRIEAASREAAYEVLFARRLYPVAASEATGAPPSDAPWWAREIGGARFRPNDLMLFTRELATLTGAELPLDVALRTLASDAAGRRQRRLAATLRDRIVQGQSLSASMAADPRTFDAAYVSLVKAGEASGTLRASLQHLAAHLERTSELRSRLASALVYPAILLLTALGAIVLIVAALLPTLLPLFEGSGAEPPAIVRGLLMLRWLLIDQWLVCALAATALLLAIVALIRNDSFRAALDVAMLRVPGLGALIAKLESARFARAMAALLRGGVPILAALGIARSVVKNRTFVAAVAGMSEAVAGGTSLRVAMQNARVFPPVVGQLVAAGEETGQLDEVLARTAEMSEAQVHRQMERALALLTPVMTLVIGVGVGGLMLSVIDAILSINDLALK